MPQNRPVTALAKTCGREKKSAPPMRGLASLRHALPHPRRPPGRRRRDSRLCKLRPHNSHGCRRRRARHAMTTGAGQIVRIAVAISGLDVARMTAVATTGGFVAATTGAVTVRTGGVMTTVMPGAGISVWVPVW